MARLDGSPDALDRALGALNLRGFERHVMYGQDGGLGFGEDRKGQFHGPAVSDRLDQLAVEQELRRGVIDLVIIPR